MNSKDYRNIREAYLQVYVPQELTEEQVWEGVEEWVNALLQEGYDLSDYTWEEMYEAYLNEGLLDDVKTDMRDSAAQKTVNKALSGGLKSTNDTKKTNPYMTGKNNSQFFKDLKNDVRDAAAQKTVNKALSGGIKPATPTTQRPATPTTQRPATPTTTAPRPTATSAASGPKSTPTTSTTPTAPTKPAIGTTPGGTKFERRTPTSAELSAAQASRASGGSEEGAIKAGVGASKPATPAPNPVKANVPGFALGGKPPTPAATPTDSGESDRLKKALDIKKSDVTSSFDYFDAVKEYLIDEGYADTEEAAVAIMGNMSDSWVRSIIG